MDRVYIAIRILIVLSVFFLPWWLTTILAVLALLKFDFFLEIVLIGLLLDVIYGTHLIFVHIPYALSLLAIILFLLTTSLKKKLLIS